MIADLGALFLGLALVAVLYAGGATLVGIRRGDGRWLESGRNALYGATALLGASVLMLVGALLADRFEIIYVWQHSSRALPLYLKVSALWGGQEGSLLLWAFMQALFAAVAVAYPARKAEPLLPWATVFLSLIAAFFAGVTLLTSNPFVTQPRLPLDGQGLNPLLRHPGMIFHPPALYVGYVGLAIPFAFALAALVTGRLEAWTIAVRTWTLFAWLGLGLGLLLGMRWAYDVLGWGGYWAWDPVENAGLMPWFTATAFLHGAVMQEERRGFRLANLLLMLFSYVLVLFGTFATRSGLIQSVHAYAQSNLGGYYLGAIAISLFGSLALILWRRRALRSEVSDVGLLSRAGLFFLTLVLFGTLTLSVFVGSVLPTLTGLWAARPFEAGPEWFDAVTGPQFAALLLLLGVCPLLGRTTATFRALRQRGWLVGVGGLALPLTAWLAGFTRPLSLVGFALVGLAGAAALLELGQGTLLRIRRQQEAPLNALWGLLRTQRRRYAGYLVHLGVVLLALGVIGTRMYAFEEDVVLRVGETQQVGEYELTYLGLQRDLAEDHTSTAASLDIYRTGVYEATLLPRLNRYISTDQSIAVPAVASGVRQDLYLILAGWTDNGLTATFRVMVNPLVNFIWLGGLIFMAGGALAFWPSGTRGTAWEVALAAAFVILLVGSAWAMWGAPRALFEGPGGRPLVGDPAPNFHLLLLDGEVFSLEEHRGEVVVLNLWASWCDTCAAELPGFQAAWEEYREAGVRFVGAAYRDDAAALTARVEEYGLTYPVGLDTGDRIARAYAITGVPETFIIGPEGRVAFVYVGPLREQLLRDKLDALLEQ